MFAQVWSRESVNIINTIQLAHKYILMWNGWDGAEWWSMLERLFKIRLSIDKENIAAHTHTVGTIGKSKNKINIALDNFSW